jgi:DNA-binding CsgD family transcriptional regulator
VSGYKSALSGGSIIVTYSSDENRLSWDSGTLGNWNTIVSGRLNEMNSQTFPSIFEQWLGQEVPDRFLVNRQGTVLWSAIKAKTLGDDTDAHHILSKIAVGTTLPNELLLPILTVGTLAQKNMGRIAIIEGAKKGTNVVARVCALMNEKSGALGVTILSSRRISDDVCADLKRLWDLSAGEIRVLAMTLQGLTAQDVAEKAEISIETVRTHVRHIYTKIGVNSREALFAALGPIIS